MNEEEKKALELLKDKAREAAMGVAEETEVYQNAENIIRKHPVLAATVKSIVDKEIGAEFDIGENKSIGFMYKPEEKKAQLGFKMSFEDGGFINKYAPGDVVLPDELKKLTVWDSMNDRIARLTDEYKAGQIGKTTISEAQLTKARLFGLKHNNVQYTNVIELTFGYRVNMLSTA